MSNNVYANGRELACKQGSGKSICAFPDVCFTPPMTPATPPGVPVPYPNTGMDSDTSSGSTSVSISGQEVMLKDKSFFKQSIGDEAGCATKKGILTSVNRGKVYFTAWSMDVKIEGENVVRHLDLTTHNHASAPGQTPPWPFAAKPAAGSGDKDPCAGERRREEQACKDFSPATRRRSVCTAAGMSKGIRKWSDAGANWNNISRDLMVGKTKADRCLRARRCRLVRYSAKKDGVNGCCKSQTADHLIPKSSFYKTSIEGAKLSDWKGYKPSAAPCMCAEGPNNTEGSHGLRHAAHKFYGREIGADTEHGYRQERDLAVKSANKVFKSSKCSKACLAAQLDSGHAEMCNGSLKSAKVKHSPSGEEVASPADLDPKTALKVKKPVHVVSPRRRG